VWVISYYLLTSLGGEITLDIFSFSVAFSIYKAETRAKMLRPNETLI